MTVHAEHKFVMSEIKVTQIEQDFWIFYTDWCAGKERISRKQNTNDDTDVHTLAKKCRRYRRKKLHR